MTACALTILFDADVNTVFIGWTSLWESYGTVHWSNPIDDLNQFTDSFWMNEFESVHFGGKSVILFIPTF